ncbi:MAG: sialidase family protein [Verrucomicrobiaceae bacterium]|nr:sialidase family protein [Verrucomicrobiaceae bacterium]
MKTILFTLLLSALQLVADEPFLEKSEVFPPELNGIARYRIPGVVVTPKGTVLAYAEARKNGSSDWGEIEIHLRRSTNGGKTWEASSQIAHHGARLEGNPRKAEGGEKEQTVNNPVAIVDRETGAIEFLYCINYARCYSMRSTDDGVTWSAPVDITASFELFREKHDWKVIATGPGHGIQIRSGRLVVPIWLAYGKAGDHAPSAAGTIYSDDHGMTWQAGELCLPNAGDFGNPNETMVTELSNGRVMLVSRSVSKANRKIVTTSPNGATDWTTPVFHDQLWEPVCMASIIAHSSKPGTLIYSNPHTLKLDKDGKEVPAGRGKRENLCIKLSHDDGKTWPINKVLDPGKAAYSDLAVLPDGTVLCLYEADTSIVCARFNLEWITTP